MDYTSHRMHAAQNLLALDYGIRNNYSLEQLMGVSEKVIDHVVGCVETKNGGHTHAPTPAPAPAPVVSTEPLKITNPDNLRAAYARYEAALQTNAGRDRVAALLRAASAMARAIKKEIQAENGN